MSKISGVQGNFYLGVVASVDESFKITADIPGIINGVNAYPVRGDCDEPKEGDKIILLGLDPEFNSYFIYWKLKENNFSGFRAFGKMININEDGEEIKIANYTGTYEDADSPEAIKGSITIKKDGSIEIEAGPGKDITLKVNGGAIKVAGNGKLTLPDSAMTMPGGTGKPFVAVPNVAFLPQGAPFQTGNEITFFGG